MSFDLRGIQQHTVDRTRHEDTHLKAVSLIYQEPLSFGRVGHLLRVLRHQWIEVCIVLFCYHSYTNTGGVRITLRRLLTLNAVMSPASIRRSFRPFLARKTLPSLWASCLRDPPWEEIWIKTFASGKSNEVSPNCFVKRRLVHRCEMRHQSSMHIHTVLYSSFALQAHRQVIENNNTSAPSIVHGWKCTVDGRMQWLFYLGDKNRVYLWVVFEVLKNLHTFTLGCWTIDKRPWEKTEQKMD